MLAADLATLFARDLDRLGAELRAVDNEAVLWRVAPGITNAMGTLALHLEGNLREYVGRLIGGVPYQRDRPLEFSARGVPQAELMRRVEAVRSLVVEVLSGLSADALEANFSEPYNGETLSVRHFLVHLYGHLNYHLGQVNYLRRISTTT